MPNKKKFSLFLIIFIVVAFLVFYFFNNKKSNLPQSQPIDGAFITQEEYQQWQNFENQENKFSFKYPSDWILETVSSSEIKLYSLGRNKIKQETEESVSSNLTIKTYNSLSELPNNLNSLSLGEWVKTEVAGAKLSLSTIANIEAYELLYDYPSKIFYFSNNRLIYSIFDDSAGENNINNQIIKSFKFN